MDSSQPLLHTSQTPAQPSGSHQSSSPSTTGPQIRSRITVVCAECKRLKLKCDRRAPCGSCTKRDTVVRCIYSPAAAEKVDLHSLNNRLIQVEAILAMITAGQNPPAFQSSYPFSFPANAQSSLFTSPPASHTHASHQHQHQHHHHYAASPSHLLANDSFTLTAHDLASIWLADLDLGAIWPSSSPSSPFASTSSSGVQRQRAFSNAENTGLIKLEPSPIDIELSSPHPPQTNSVIDVDASSSSSTRSAFPSRAPSPLKRDPFPSRADLHPPSQQRKSTAQLLLPALSIYYPLPTIPPPGSSAVSSAAFPRHLPSASTPASSSLQTTAPVSNASVNSGYALPSSQPQYTRPQVTPALIALLPPLQACRRLFASAREVLRVRPIPFEPGGAGSTQAHAQSNAQEQGWQTFERRCLALLGGGTSKERDRERERKEREKEKAREARRARQIYFGGIPGLQQQQETGTDMDIDGGEGSGSGGGRGNKTSRSTGESANGNDDAAGDDQSLTLFALMCVVLAMGAAVSPSSSTSSSSTSNSNTSPMSPRATAETPAFLYALSQQALGVWDTHHTALAAGHAHPHLPSHSQSHLSASVATAEEGEKMDYLLACIAGLAYLLLTSAPGRSVGVGSVVGSEESLSERDGGSGLGSGSSLGLSVGAASGSGAALIYALVGKLVNAARGMGLARDASVLSSVLSRKGKQQESSRSPSVSLGAPSAGAATNTGGGSGGAGGGTGGGKGASKREREAERERIREEWKKMIWWEVLFYDLFTSDALGHQPYIPAHLFGVKLPACASLPSPLMAPVPMNVDDQESEEDDSSSMHTQQEGGYREKNKVQRATPPSLSVGDAVDRAEEEYLGARYRLTQLAQNIKNRLAHPDCCCGYTLDQAVSLEAEVRRWQTALPVSLKWVEDISIATPTLAPAIAPGSEANAYTNTAVAPPFGPKPTVSDNGTGIAERVRLLHRCELAVMANVLLIKMYTPFLRHSANASEAPNTNVASSGGSPSSKNDIVTPISSAAAQTTVHAAHAILKAVKEIYATQSYPLTSTFLLSISSSSSPTSSSSPSASPGKIAVPTSDSSQKVAAAAISPSMFDLYPLDKLVFDAVVICAHAAQVMAGKVSSSALPFVSMDGAALLDDAAFALGWLLGEHPQGVGSICIVLGDDQRRIAEALYKRAVHRVGANHGMKRKHSQVDLSGPFGAISTGYQSSNHPASNTLPEHGWNGDNATQVEQYQQSHTNVVELHSSSPSASRSSVPPANFLQDNLTRTEHQKQEMTSAVRLAAAARSTEQGDDEKEKKHAKKEKHPTYPSVGVRIRPNKDRDNSSRASRQHSFSGASGGGNPQPLMTSTPRPLPAADAVLAYQQQHKQKLMLPMQPAMPTMSNSQSSYEQDLNRSRSSSISHIPPEHVQQQQQQQQQQPQQQHPQYPTQNQSQRPDGSPKDLRYPIFGATPLEVSNVNMMHRKRFSIPEHQSQPQPQPHQQHKHHQQPLSPEQPPFTPNVYDQSQTHPQAMYESQTYDAMPNPSGTGVEGMGYSTVSSPFSNGGAPTSSSGSPFTTTSVVSSGHPSTPTFPQHHPAAPVFGPQPPAPTSSPTAYFHTPTAFTESSYPGPTASSSHLSQQQQHNLQQSMPLAGMNMDQTVISIPSAPQSYEKQPQQHEVTMYDVKSGVEHQQITQQQQMQQHQPMDAPYEGHDMSGQNHAIAMGMSSPATWAPMGEQPQQQQQQQHPPPSNHQPFWNNSAEYRFYP